MEQKTSVIKTLIKQWMCRHERICTTTESYFDKPLFMVKSIIKCDNCEKTFPMHPNAKCCHVQHLHSELMREEFYKQYKSIRQPQGCECRGCQMGI